MPDKKASRRRNADGSSYTRFRALMHRLLLLRIFYEITLKITYSYI